MPTALSQRIKATPSKATLTRPPARLPVIPVPGAEASSSPAASTSATLSDDSSPTTIDLNLYSRDKDVLRELTAFIAAEGRTANRSVLIRAALQVAKKDQAFLAAYDQIEASDPRRQKKR